MAIVTSLLLICHVFPLAFAVLQPPTNLKLTSKNFQHILTWDEPNNESPIYYRVDCHVNGNRVVQSKSCSNITSRICDLTKDFTDVYSSYRPVIFSFTDHEVSKRVATNEFNPLMNTLLGPPLVDVTPCGHFLKVSIQPPVSYLWDESAQLNISMLRDDVYPGLDYTIHITHSSEGEHIIETSDTSNTTIIPNLLPNTNYCVSVDVKSSLNIESSIPSAQKCVFTAPIEGSATHTPARKEVIVPVVCGLLLFLGILLSLFALDRAGYIGMRRKLFPKVLKSWARSDSIYSDNNAITPQGYVVPVEIVSQKLEVEESQDNEEKYEAEGYASRKKLVDSDTSGGDSSGPMLSSIESSGQMTGSSSEERIPIERPVGLAIIKESSESLVPIAANDLEVPSDLPIDNSGVFNINLNSICRGNPPGTRIDLHSGGPLEEGPDVDTGQSGLSINGNIFICTPNVFVNLEPTAVEYGSDDYEEDLCSDRDDTCDADDHVVSGYMRR